MTNWFLNLINGKILTFIKIKFDWTGDIEPMDKQTFQVRRKWYTKNSTIGELWMDDAFQCFTLERTSRKRLDNPSYKPCVPSGTYEVIVNFSDHFQRDLPLLLKVPGYEGIRIHPGNTAKDTEGCLLVGVSRGDDFVRDSRIAFDAIFEKIKQKLALGHLNVVILGGPDKEV